MDDAGLSLVRKSKGKGFLFVLGNALIQLLPWVIKVLAVVGTIALLLVSGEIFSHNIHFFQDLLPTWPAMLKELLLGIAAGTIVVFLLALIAKLLPKKKAKI
jgi:predicted DNA repair protein MutK